MLAAVSSRSGRTSGCWVVPWPQNRGLGEGSGAALPMRSYVCTESQYSIEACFVQ